MEFRLEKPERGTMEHRVNAMEQQTYKADAEIYEVLGGEIIDLTIRPGSLLSENPLCARFGAPRSLIRVVFAALAGKRAGEDRALQRYYRHPAEPGDRGGADRERAHAVEARVLRDFFRQVHPGQRALIRSGRRLRELAHAEHPDFNRLYEADRLLHETWFAAMGKMYLWRTLQSAPRRLSRFRMLDTMTSGGLAEVIADHTNLIEAIERCDLAAFEPLVERHLCGGIRRLGSKLTEEYADYF